jgi:FixJ family two-component response regulator
MESKVIQSNRTTAAVNLMIYIIDDDSSVRESLSDLVQSLGFAAATFGSAEEYLQSGRINSTSCVVTDVRMPGMSGIDLQRRLIADRKDIPIIFITSFPDENSRARALKAGAIGYLRKPFDDHSLIECLDQALARRKPTPFAQ